jgi:hypothetical protein
MRAIIRMSQYDRPSQSKFSERADDLDRQWRIFDLLLFDLLRHEQRGLKTQSRKNPDLQYKLFHVANSPGE